jgi:hypothetical protein
MSGNSEESTSMPESSGDESKKKKPNEIKNAAKETASATNKATDAAGNAAEYNLEDTNPETAKNAGSALKSKLDISKSPFSSIEKVEKGTPIKSANPNYLTNFCKNRNTPKKEQLKILGKIEKLTQIKKKWKEYAGSLALAGLVFLYALWILIKYYDLLIPFAGGGLSLLKYLIIYFIAIALIVTFFKFTSYFSFWYVLFMKYFRLFMNPLLNDKVSFLYCYFTDYINWLIYFPAKFFYFCILFLVILLLILIILPVLSILSFAIGYLFSLLGEGASINVLSDKIKGVLPNPVAKPVAKVLPKPVAKVAPAMAAMNPMMMAALASRGKK